jgi:hypothetical protein
MTTARRFLLALAFCATPACAAAGLDDLEVPVDEEIDGMSDDATRTREHGDIEVGATDEACLEAARERHTWNFELADAGDVVIETGAVDGDRVDTALDIYRRSSTRWVRTTTNDDGPSSAPFSAISLSLQAGRYRFAVRGAKTTTRGCFTVKLSGDTGGVTEPTGALTANDVSILYPLPSGGDWSDHLAARTAGRGGALIPRAMFDRLPRLHATTGTGAGAYDAMRVVGVRVDPCFTKIVGGACDHQIRMIFQPIAEGMPLDAAAHAFYSLESADFASLIDELRTLHGEAPENDETALLGVSPALAAQGVTGAYGTGLRETLLRYAGEDTLSRITFMTREPSRETSWRFGVFDVVDGALVAGEVHGTREEVQQLNQGPFATPFYTMTPMSSDDDLSGLMTAGAAGTETERLEAYRVALTLMNPTMRVPDQVQCAGCHVVNAVAAYAESQYAFGERSIAERFTSRRNLRTRSQDEGSAQIVRAFGYFDERPIVVARVANETALVLDELNR